MGLAVRMATKDNLALLSMNLFYFQVFVYSIRSFFLHLLGELAQLVVNWFLLVYIVYRLGFISSFLVYSPVRLVNSLVKVEPGEH